VIIDTNTLSTLPLREIRAGLAEVMKYGIISDNEFFNRLHIDIPRMLKREPGSFEDAIARSCAIKADVVTQDETEQGVRAILNYGHTVGHAIEALSGFRKLLHGEAVAIGMVSASLIGEEMGITPVDVTADILALLRKAHLPWALPEEIKLEDILSSMMRDKKTLSHKLNLVLAEKIGSAHLYREISQDIVLRSLKRHASLSSDTE
jgi:3-dehydroquinate synthase